MFFQQKNQLAFFENRKDREHTVWQNAETSVFNTVVINFTTRI